MTYEEALEIYKLGNYGSELSKAEADYWLANIDTATELAFKCLEKQIPKPKHKYMGYRCVCGEEVAKNQAYCEYCGQRLLDWSDK